ncbi:MAG: hypothetical protein KAX38_06400 [Candidatus Krumholzibacteria bacterium]|nr:hypothetical protein [Candidatus Krumholzibacteria bacterium]
MRVISFMSNRDKVIQCRRCLAIGPVGKDLEKALELWGSRVDSGVGELDVDRNGKVEIWNGRKFKELGSARLRKH